MGSWVDTVGDINQNPISYYLLQECQSDVRGEQADMHLCYVNLLLMLEAGHTYLLKF